MQNAITMLDLPTSGSALGQNPPKDEYNEFSCHEFIA